MGNLGLQEALDGRWADVRRSAREQLAGTHFVAVPGETTNVHVTTSAELEMAERMLALPGSTSRAKRSSP